MAMNDHPTALRRPNLDTLDFERVVFDYDRESDTLLLLLFGRGRPAVILPGDKYIDLWLDPGTKEIIGFQIEGYLSHVVYQQPRLLGLAELAGIRAEEIERIRQGITPDKRKRAAIDALIDHGLPASA